MRIALLDRDTQTRSEWSELPCDIVLLFPGHYGEIDTLLDIRFGKAILLANGSMPLSVLNHVRVVKRG